MSFLKSWLFGGYTLPNVTLTPTEEKVENKNENKIEDKVFNIKELATIVKESKNNLITISLLSTILSDPITIQIQKKDEYNFMKNKILQIHLFQLIKKENKIIPENFNEFKIVN
jgi:hypothetical protein